MFLRYVGTHYYFLIDFTGLLKVKSWESSGHFEGDIIFKKDSQSAAIIGNEFRWPKAKIPYTYSAGDLSI